MKSTIAAAKKAAKKAVKKAAVKKTAVKKTAKKTAAKKAATKVVTKAPAKKVVKKAAKKTLKKTASANKTTISAGIDVGFGNTLFLRGDAPGLSWSQGVPMDCDENSVWSITISGVKEAFEFKVLINDSYWSSGYNHTAAPGKSIKIEPIF